MRLLTVLFLCLAFELPAQINADKVAITASLSVQQDAWNKGSVAEFMTAYWKNDSLQFIGSKGITYGWQKTLDNYLKSYDTKEKMGRLSFTILEMNQISETAVYVVGRWQLAREKPVGGHFTLLWRKINGQWLIVSDHSS